MTISFTRRNARASTDHWPHADDIALNQHELGPIPRSHRVMLRGASLVIRTAVSWAQAGGRQSARKLLRPDARLARAGTRHDGRRQTPCAEERNHGHSVVLPAGARSRLAVEAGSHTRGGAGRPLFGVHSRPHGGQDLSKTVSEGWQRRSADSVSRRIKPSSPDRRRCSGRRAGAGGCRSRSTTPPRSSPATRIRLDPPRRWSAR